jgi:hypothetical protein
VTTKAPRPVDVVLWVDFLLTVKTLKKSEQFTISHISDNCNLLLATCAIYDIMDGID